MGDLGASPSAVSGVTLGIGSTSPFTGPVSCSFFSSAVTAAVMSGTSGTCESGVCSGTAVEEEDSRLPSSEREREAETGRGVVSVASSKVSCGHVSLEASTAGQRGSQHSQCPFRSCGSSRAAGPCSSPPLCLVLCAGAGLGWSSQARSSSWCKDAVKKLAGFLCRRRVWSKGGNGLQRTRRALDFS